MSTFRTAKWHPISLIRRAQSRSSVNHPEAGLTLLECLAAITVVGFIGAAIAPVMVISIATRIQSQKSEQALSLAQGEVDRIRVLIERDGGGDLASVPLPPAVTLADITAGQGPDGLSTSADYYDADYTKARDVDIDPENNNGPDFAVQVYRDDGVVAGGQPVAFALGVRVYEYETVEGATGNLDTDQAAIGLTQSQGERGVKPLATLYTTVAFGEDDQSLCNYFDYIDSTSTDKPVVGCN